MSGYSPKAASVWFMLLATSLFAAISLVAKSLGTGIAGPELHPVQVTTGRFCFALLLLAPIYMVQRPGLQGVPWVRHIARSIAGWLSVTCLFFAATRIPLADANAVGFMSVIFTMGLSIPFLGEKVGVRRWTAAVIALAGSLILIQPGTDAFRPAALIALLAAFFISIESILIKQLSSHEPPVRILFINNCIGAMISLLAVIYVWVSPSLLQWGMLAGIGFTMVLVQTSFIQAMKRMEASFVTPFWYAVPLFAALYDYLLFEHLPSAISVAGIILITLGGVVICRRS